MLGKQEEKGMTEDEMAGWHHRLNGHEFGWTPGVGDGQESLVCCSPWGHMESDIITQFAGCMLLSLINLDAQLAPPRQGSIQFSSVTQSCLTLCDPMDCSTPGLPVHH